MLRTFEHMLDPGSTELAEGCRDPPSGQPKVFEAPACSRIRASDRVRRKNRNEKNSIPN
jgi:hypothetical protein